MNAEKQASDGGNWAAYIAWLAAGRPPAAPESKPEVDPLYGDKPWLPESDDS